MALIKKQIFRPSKDENLQQFLAKDGADKARWPALTSRSMLETYRQDALDDSRRSVEQGQAEANKKAKAKKAVKSEPKSPWDDESDALAQKAFEVDPEGGAKQYDKKERDAKRQRLFERSVKYLKDNYPDQGSDNSNSADDTTGKQIKLAVQDAWFGKGSRDDLFPPGTPSSWAQMDAALASKKESAKRPPGKGQKAKWVAEDYDADEDGPHKVEGHWSAKEFIIEGVQKAWLEKRGPVDRLTGGRVKFENKPEKQYAPESVDWTGRELQVTGKNSKLMRGAARALGAKKTVSPSMESTQTKRATKAAGLDYAAKSVGDAVWDAWFEKARSRRNQEKVRETRRRWRGDDSPPKNRQTRALTSQTLGEERDWQNDPYQPSLDAGETEWAHRQAAIPAEKTRRRGYRAAAGDSNKNITTQVANPDRKSLSEYGNKRTKKLVDRARREQRSPEARAKREDANKTDTLKNRQNYSPSDQYHHDVKQQRRKDKGIVVDQRKVTSRQMHGDQPFTPRRMSEWPKKQAE